MSGAIFYALARPLLFSLDAERAHRLALGSLKLAESAGTDLMWGESPVSAPRSILGLSFPNPVGLAAGLDKDGDYIDALGRLGFGFIEVGTVTPRAQPGNLKPRLFRLPAARALINRMGFNNGGLDRLLANLARTRYSGILGINIGKNADTLIENALDDYLACLRGVYAHASYVAVNISSPNTRDLRKLQAADELDHLLQNLKAEQERLADQHGRYVPLVVKIAPDLDETQVGEVGALLLHHRMDGAIATNTTVARCGVEALRHGREHGGLSGGPLLGPSNRVLTLLRRAVGTGFPIIGVGGILSGDDARRKVQAGADLIQLYTGLIYRGPTLVGEAVRAMQP